MVTKFQQSVYKATKKISRGKVSTYAGIAMAIKNPRAARAVGNALNSNPYAPAIPCHRVVRSDGTVGGFASGNKEKIRLLKKEGIEIKGDKIINFKKRLFRYD